MKDQTFNNKLSFFNTAKILNTITKIKLKSTFPNYYFLKNKYRR